MAIDKIIPRRLVKDRDERLVQEGNMIDALNVTISETGEGTEGVIKNIYGTTVAAGTIEHGSDLSVVGKVKDIEKSFVYFFVRDNTVSNLHKIVRYDDSAAKFRIIIESSVLNFQEGAFVKGDIVNSDFKKDSTSQSILYFTDNHNPPRKLNIDRAIDGDYYGLSDDDLKKHLSVIKSAPSTHIGFSYETDDDVFFNNVAGKFFQFASQLVFTDGEVSAISPYSKLAVSESAAFSGLGENDGVAGVSNEQNLLRLNLNFSDSESDFRYVPDVKKFRLLAREGNDGSFFLVDEFDPSKSKNESFNGSSFQVYNASSSTYKFFNIKNQGVIDSNTVNKTFDNVPLKAEAQAVVGNRLVYGNYEEGRPTPTTTATITVLYDDETGVNQVFDSTVDVVEFAAPSNSISPYKDPQITIDLLKGSSFDSFSSGTADKDTQVPKGVNIQFKFEFDPVGE